jgi:hypothetical protein
VSVPPTRRDVFLIDGRTDPPVRVPAVVFRDVPPDVLVKVEERWQPARKLAKVEIAQAGGFMEHAHWDWKNKIAYIEQGHLLLSAVECGGAIQGLIAVAAAPKYAALSPGAQALYVDYVEVAPWNLRTMADPPMYEGVGSALLADVVRRSRELGHAGRVGLHSLPSVEGYYRHCRLTDLGMDPAYHGLRYFEYTEGDATAWVSLLEGST